MDQDARLLALHSYDILDTPPERGFDDVALMARELCAAPIALVSLVDADRQWFKARIGFPDCQTDLDRSVCRHVVAERATLIIPDLTADPRTRDNPLVTHDPHVRFYAGAPLTTNDGQVLGALCVLDVVPRPAGLSDAQRRQLESLARQVVDLLELRLSISQRDRALEARNTAEASSLLSNNRWRTLFDGISEGFVLACVVRDDAGEVVDWRYVEVNRAWSSLTGLLPADAIGRRVSEVMPNLASEWISQPAEVVRTGISSRFTREVEELGRWYEGHIQPADDDCFTVLFTEVTERLTSTQRAAALLEVGDALRECATTAEMTRTAAAIVGKALNASRAGYGQVDAGTETVDIEGDWRLEGLPSIAGRHRFADFGSIRDELARAEPLVIHDVDTDPRTAADPAPMHALKIGALVNMPVRERGHTVAVFIVQSEKPRRWTGEELAFIRNVSDRLEVGIARLRGEQRQHVLNREIGHRLKNSLSMVQAIAMQTMRKSAEPEALQTFGARLQALGLAHEALINRNLRGADLYSLIDKVLETASVTDRCRLSGPAIEFGDGAALSASLLFHELATNAIKYGALSVPDGHVEIRWTVEDDTLRLTWAELGGPPASPPTRRGFGSTIVRLGLAGTGGAVTDYGSAGLNATFEASIRQVAA